MAVDPALDFFSDGTVLALTLCVVSMSSMWLMYEETYVLAGTTTSTCGTIQEVLLQTIAHTSSKLWATAAEHAVAVVASVRVVALCIASHDCLALLVTRCTLATGACQPVTTTLAIGLGLVFWTVRTCSIACLLRVALASARATDSAGGCKLTVAAAVLVRVIANGSALEFARVWVTTLVVATSGCTATITLFIAFDNTIATCLPCNARDALVVGKTT
jgi:hypothetical protein